VTLPSPAPVKKSPAPPPVAVHGPNPNITINRAVLDALDNYARVDIPSHQKPPMEAGWTADFCSSPSDVYSPDITYDAYLRRALAWLNIHYGPEVRLWRSQRTNMSMTEQLVDLIFTRIETQAAAWGVNTVLFGEYMFHLHTHKIVGVVNPGHVYHHVAIIAAWTAREYERILTTPTLQPLDCDDLYGRYMVESYAICPELLPENWDAGFYALPLVSAWPITALDCSPPSLVFRGRF
jgi:hypothetical protein